MVRQSSQSDTMALSVRLPPGKGPYIEHYLIQANKGKLSLETSENRFDNIPSLIAHYSQCWWVASLYVHFFHSTGYRLVFRYLRYRDFLPIYLPLIPSHRIRNRDRIVMINRQIFVRGLIYSVAFIIELLFLWRAKIHARRPNPGESRTYLDRVHG